jgi:hypothetical protein
MHDHPANPLALGLTGLAKLLTLCRVIIVCPQYCQGRSCMEIMQRRELWIHTHFVTDCVRLSHAQGCEIEAALLPVLRQHHIVYSIHFNALVGITTRMLP